MNGTTVYTIVTHWWLQSTLVQVIGAWHPSPSCRLLHRVLIEIWESPTLSMVDLAGSNQIHVLPFWNEHQWQGCLRSGKSQGKFLFFKVREKSGNSVKSQGKFLDMRKSGKSQGILWWIPMILSLSQSYTFMFLILVPCMDPGGKILISFYVIWYFPL